MNTFVSTPSRVEVQNDNHNDKDLSRSFKQLCFKTWQKRRLDVYETLSKHFIAILYQPNIPFSNKFLPTKPTCLNTEDRVVWFVSMEPPNTTILYFKMILSLLMERVATNCVEYWVKSFVGIKLDPRCNAYGLAWFYLKSKAKYKNTTLKHTFQ